jgi:hypothetical protein
MAVTNQKKKKEKLLLLFLQYRTGFKASLVGLLHHLLYRRLWRLHHRHL